MGLLRKVGILDMFKDEVDIYRNQLIDDGYGGTIEEEVLVGEKLSCKLSQKSLGATTGDNINASTQEYKLFIPFGLEVKQNDRLVITRNNAKYNARASQPFKYGHHEEIVLKEVKENGY